MRKPVRPTPEIGFVGRPPFPDRRARRDAESLIRRVLPASEAVLLEPLTASRGAARVFKATAQGRDGPVGAPVVVKIGPLAQIAPERAGYGRYIRGLPAGLRPELLGWAEAGGFGALCFAWAGGAETLTQALARGDGAALERVLAVLGDATGDRWRAPHLIRAEPDIARRYRDRHFAGRRALARTEAALFACAARFFGAGRAGGHWRVGDLSFPSPLSTLFDSDQAIPYRSAIVHGDLNSDNILLADERVTLVDFRHSGRGHGDEDLIALEASIRINWPEEAGFGKIWEIERAIALGQGSGPYAAAIVRVRAEAGIGPGLDTDAYQFAVAAIGLRLMQATDLTAAARARITAASLWALKALAG